MAGTWFTIARAGQLPEGEMLEVECAGREVCLYNLNGTLYATEAKCTHGDASLADGCIVGEEVECPFHQGLFHIPSGRATGAPCTEDLQVYPVRQEDDQIAIFL